MNLPKVDDNDKTHKNDANHMSWHLINSSFWASASYEQLKPLVLESRKILIDSVIKEECKLQLLNFS